MPPKIKITREEIIDAAIDMTRREGIDALNARGLASALGVSTQPIFSSFSSMIELRREVIIGANAIFEEFTEKVRNVGKYPPYKATGIAYIGFAKEERELFKLLFMRSRSGESTESVTDRSHSAAVETIMAQNGYTRELAELFQLEMWSFVHGIAVMIATDFLTLDEELISDMLTDIFQGLKSRIKEKCK